MADTQIFIDLQHADRRATDCSPANETWSVPREVPMPGVAARMKESRYLASERINPCQIRTLVPVAQKTRQAEIVCHRIAAVRRGNNVVDLKRQRIERLRHLVVFAIRPRTVPDEFCEFSIHE